ASDRLVSRPTCPDEYCPAGNVALSIGTNVFELGARITARVRRIWGILGFRRYSDADALGTWACFCLRVAGEHEAVAALRASLVLRGDAPGELGRCLVRGGRRQEPADPQGESGSGPEVLLRDHRNAACPCSAGRAGGNRRVDLPR